MMDLINFKDTLEELNDQIIDINREMEYRRIELTGRCSGSSIECGRRFDQDDELLSRDIIYNYLKAKLNAIRCNTNFLEIYGTSVYDAEKQYNKWAANAIIKKEDEE